MAGKNTKTIEEYIAELDMASAENSKLKEAKDALEIEVEEFKAKLEISEDKVTELTSEVEKYKKEATHQLEKVEELQDEIENMSITMGKLNAKLEATESGKLEATEKVLTIDGEQYEVVIPEMNHKGQKVNYEILKDDAELAKKLVSINSGMLKQIVKPSNTEE